jgi:hypothetical protein
MYTKKEESFRESTIPTGVSAPPDGWVEPARLGKKGRRPKNGLPLAAASLTSELRKNAPALIQELGPKGVDPEQVAAALEEATQWDGVAAKAATFDVYARSQRGTSWDAALALMGGLKLGVRYAIARDATFADRFPGVAKAFAPRRYSKKAKKKKAAGDEGTE